MTENIDDKIANALYKQKQEQDRENLLKQQTENMSKMQDQLTSLGTQHQADLEIEKEKNVKLTQLIENLGKQQNMKYTVTEIKKTVDEKNLAKENKVDCPTCEHNLKRIGKLKIKCTGPDCENEYALVSKKSDHQCTNCGLPIKKPTKESDEVSCPFCKSEHFKPFDWKKIKNRFN